MHYKNRKPKKHKGCCVMCCAIKRGSRTRKRGLTLQEKRAKISEKEEKSDR